MGTVESTEATGGFWAFDLLQRRRSSTNTRQMTVSDSRRSMTTIAEDAEWKQDLDSWRERRRRISLMQSPLMLARQLQIREEENRHEEEVRDRVRRLKARRSMSLCTREQYVMNSSPENSLRFLPSKSPKEDNTDRLEFLEKQSNHDTDGASTVINAVNNLQDNFQKDSRIPETTEDGTCGQVNTPNEKPSFVKTEIADGTKSALPALNAEVSQILGPEATEHPVELCSQDGIQNGFAIKSERYVNLRIQPRPGLKEVNLGLTLRAEGSSDTAPFIVERVKPGSSADVCDVQKGDTLVKLDNISLNSGEGTTLDQMKATIAKSAYAKRAVSLCVLRNASENNTDSDSDMKD
ncbi:unnamed protein product [Calicophoron daubneyi]|uniref:PDZ domain-containing protein n=1 Tax=Calicophoron daubneyi TaxID=300641 RepID=A0AAV2TXJ9_CALDB